jgi:hypothetical protein
MTATVGESPDLLSILFDDFVRLRQYVRWNRQADLLRRFEVDDEVKLLRLLDGQIRGLPTLENLVYVCGCASE